MMVFGVAVLRRTKKLAAACPFATLSLVLLFCTAGRADSIGSLNDLPAPGKLHICMPGSQLDTLDQQMADRLGAELVGCYVSEQKLLGPRRLTGALPLGEHALAMASRGGSYRITDIDRVLAFAREQWKTLDPSSDQNQDVTSRINQFMQTVNSKPDSAKVAFLSPTLISIERPGPNYYYIVSIKHFVLQTQVKMLPVAKVEATATVLQGQRLVYLTMLRTLKSATDVVEVRTEIAEWARAVAEHQQR